MTSSLQGPRTGVEGFESGRRAGRTPAGVGRSSGEFLTTTTSPWLGLRCRTCAHTFRRGDRVFVTDDGLVEHVDPRLRCHGHPDPAAGREPALRVRDFNQGLLDAWPPVNDTPVLVLEAADWQVARRSLGVSAALCPGCGHTFRAGDMVILCPCSAVDPSLLGGGCQLPIHRDPSAGLTCWDDWRPDGTLVRCPRTHEKLTGQAER
jgi:hypothetical protein